MAQLQAFFCFLLRIALAATLLSAVADRFGFWGSSGNIIWGNFQTYLAYTKKMGFFIPSDWISFTAWTVTVIEVILGVLLLLGLFHRTAAYATGIVLLVFAIGMAVSMGIKLPLNYSMFVASAAAFLLATTGPGWLAADQLRN